MSKLKTRVPKRVSQLSIAQRLHARPERVIHARIPRPSQFTTHRASKHALDPLTVARTGANVVVRCTSSSRLGGGKHASRGVGVDVFHARHRDRCAE